MSAGELDRRVQLQQLVTTRDEDFGSEIQSWVTVTPVWARITERDAREATTADQRVMTRRITVRIRWRSDVTSIWRVLHGERRLRIAGTVEVGRRKYLDLTCEETDDA
jgi:SPP1 family predicted phage head-tail adaptor